MGHIGKTLRNKNRIKDMKRRISGIYEAFSLLLSTALACSLLSAFFFPKARRRVVPVAAAPVVLFSFVSLVIFVRLPETRFCSSRAALTSSAAASWKAAQMVSAKRRSANSRTPSHDTARLKSSAYEIMPMESDDLPGELGGRTW